VAVNTIQFVGDDAFMERLHVVGITLIADNPAPHPETSVFTPTVAILTDNILADPDARMLEFEAFPMAITARHA
jgi:hypothetical protein